MRVNRYNIRIDGEVMPNSYTYEELLLNDILEFDDIEVKQVSKSNWTNIKSYYFPEEHEDDQSTSQDFYGDENGQAHFNGNQSKKKESDPEYVINEFGEMVRRGSSSSSNSAGTTSTPTSSTRSSSSTSSSSDGNGWKIFFTIVAIVIFIVITCTTGWGSIPAGIVGYYTLKTIWGDDL